MNKLSTTAEIVFLAHKNSISTFGLDKNLNKILSDLKNLEPYAEKLANFPKIKNYLMKDINELRFFELINNNAELLRIEELLPFKETWFEKLSSFEYSDFDIIFKNKTSYQQITAYFYIYIKRLKRRLQINTPYICDIFYILEDYFHSNSKDIFLKFLQTDEKKIIPIFYLPKKIDLCNMSWDVMIEKINNPDIYAFLGYFSQYYNYFPINKIPKENTKIILSNVIRAVITKLKHIPNVDFKEIMKNVTSFLLETEFDLELFKNFIKNLPERFFEKENTVTDYINIAYNNRYSTIIQKTSDFDNNINNLIIYSIKNKKATFLKLLEKTIDDGKFHANQKIGLFKFPEFYQNMVNLNEINESDFLNIVNQYSSVTAIYPIQLQNLTPKEHLILFDITKQKPAAIEFFYLFYASLTLKIDKKIIILRQVANNIENFEHSKDDILRLAKRLSEKNLTDHIKSFSFLISSKQCLEVLFLSDEYQNLILEAKNEEEIKFLCRNKNIIDKTKSLSDIKKTYLETDLDCVKMFQVMNLSDNFIQKNIENIKDFCMKGNASIVMKYYSGIDDTRKSSILKAAKAEMCKEMEYFKFFDLKSEIEYEISDQLKEYWIENKQKKNAKFSAYETYSFSDTMLIGCEPSITCMNYKDGMYRNCLLANFDSNKKILFARLNGKIVSRAIIRLTKIKKSINSNKKELSFLDIETEHEKNITPNSEKLVLFLERSYHNHINESDINEVNNLFCQIAYEKAKEMEIDFLAAPVSYKKCDLKTITTNVYISYTKNGCQYLDSFGGNIQSSSEKEGSYENISCFTK